MRHKINSTEDGIDLLLLQTVLYIIIVINHDTTYWKVHYTVKNTKKYSAI